MGITIKDVAKLAKVSTMTVSRVVNNTGTIAVETRKRVLDAIDTLHYKPNTIARTLVAQKSRIISLIVPDIANPFFSELIKHAEAEAKRFGYNLFIGDAGWDITNEREFIDSSIGRMSDGVILVTPRLPDEELQALSAAIPLVVVDRSMAQTKVMDVYVDNYDGAFEATEFLIEAGHERIGYIRGWEDVLNTKRREQGYADALKKHGIPYRPELIQVGDYREQSGYNAFKYFIELSERPTAVFASNDMMAYGFISACIQNGVRIPYDISVMGFDDITLFFEHVPRLSTVSHPRIPMIRKAVDMLLGLPADEISKFDAELHTELVIRDSVSRLD